MMCSVFQKYKAVNGMFIAELDKIDLPPYVLSKECTEITIDSANGTYFEASSRSLIDTNLPTGHIRADRYVWFS